IRHLPPEVKRGIKQALRALSVNPDVGEPLRRELEGLWKYRVKRLRIVYAIDRANQIIRIVAVGHRGGIYETVAEQQRDRSEER
ncbi:MAG: type II toxin-antitoxin system RelE family toxin, partial [Candidatus Binatia bacterium]